MKLLLATLLERLESKGYEIKPKTPHLPHSPQAKATRNATQQTTGKPRTQKEVIAALRARRAANANRLDLNT